jgi:hypothetical protein
MTADNLEFDSEGTPDYRRKTISGNLVNKNYFAQKLNSNILEFFFSDENQTVN